VGFDGFVGPSADASSDAARDGTTMTDGAMTSDSASSDATEGSSDGGADATIDAPAILRCDAPGLVAYWPMNEGTGTVVHDCKSGFDGMFGGAAVTWGTRDGGGSLVFAGTGYVTLGARPGLQLTGPITVAGYIRIDSLPSQYASLFWNFYQNNGYELTVASTNELYGQVGNGADNAVAHFPTPQLGVWHHVVFVFEPSVRVETFLDGVSVQKLTTSDDGGPFPIANVTPSTNDQLFGALDNGSWSGAISNLRIFARALTQDEIAVLASQ
jgi:hypothetical protein